MADTSRAPRSPIHSRAGASSPPRARRPTTSGVPRGFLAPPKPKRRPLEDLSVSELQELHGRNARILASPGPSTSSYVERVSAEQAAVESRLIDLIGVEALRRTLEATHIGIHDDTQDHDMDGSTTDPPLSRAIGAKQRALARYGQHAAPAHRTVGASNSFTIQEAERLQQEAHIADRRRQQDQEAKRQRMGLPIKGEHAITREEQEARIYRFMNYKPTESDLEDDDDDDDDDDDPSGWFEDPEDDGRKGQDIVEPDFDDDLSGIIRIDESKVPGTFYGSHDRA